MIGKVTATKEQQEAFKRVEVAKHLADLLYVGSIDDQVLMYRFYKHDVERFEDEYQKEMEWA
ncbi:hypothetical protein [Limosilactobacillus agrestimuris]|uniref:hypothetical protein n=1 Tax=Limosilactobacillus agrestimuris TaxID=2941331 RepID=UPI00203DB104|nr:hypothetical protein [Limosilactobacillus agrestimuris]